MSYLTAPLNNSHKKEAFSCGKPLLDHYLHTQAKQDVKRQISACFVLTEGNAIVSGYYTLSAAGILREQVPEGIRKKLPPSYQDLPATLLGRLAVDSSLHGKGIGEKLLLDALKRSYDATASVASMAVIVDPIDELAAKFYNKYGLISLPDSGKQFLPMKTIAELFGV